MKRQFTTIFVNPVPRISAQGRDKQVYTVQTNTGELIPSQPMHKTKEFGANDILQFQYDHNTNRLVTGLDVTVENPFYERSVEDVIQEYQLSSRWQTIIGDLVKQKKILKQTLFEISDAVEPGFYSSEIKGGTMLKHGFGSRNEDVNFLQSFKIILYDRPNRFTDETPRGRISIQLLKTNQKVAQSLNEVNSAVHSWYISEENEAEIERNKKRSIINKSIYHTHKLQNEETPFLNYQVAILCKDRNGDPIIKGEVAESTVIDALNSYVSNESAHQMSNIEKFESVYGLLQTREGIDKFNVMYLVQQAINTRVVVVSDGYYVWNSKVSSGNNVSKFTDYDKLVSFLIKEKSTYNPEDKDVTNWYGELLDEVKLKNVRFD